MLLQRAACPSFERWLGTFLRAGCAQAAILWQSLISFIRPCFQNREGIYIAYKRLYCMRFQCLRKTEYR